MSIATRLAQDIRNAYDSRSRDDLERHLVRMVQAMEYAGPTTKVHPVHPIHTLPKAPPPLCETTRASYSVFDVCDRRLGNCECKDLAARAVCMHRKAPLHGSR